MKQQADKASDKENNLVVKSIPTKINPNKENQTKQQIKNHR
jgi:hypothetical protein